MKESTKKNQENEENDQKVEALYSALTEKVVDQLLPKIVDKMEEIEKRLRNEFRTEIDDLKKNTPKTEPVGLNDIYNKAMNDPELQKMIKTFQGASGIQGGSPNMNQSGNGMGSLMEFMNMLKMLDPPPVANTNPFGNELMYRQFLADQHAKNMFFNQMTKYYMVKLGASPDEIRDYDKTQGYLSEPMRKIGDPPSNPNEKTDN